jgi:hypothetical protein
MCALLTFCLVGFGCKDEFPALLNAWLTITTYRSKSRQSEQGILGFAGNHCLVKQQFAFTLQTVVSKVLFDN